MEGVFGAWQDPGRQRLWIAAAALVCLAPFLGKAIHIDDPLFIRGAEQVLRAPLDFYGFEMNWHGFSEPFASVNKNPPLVSFYLAGVASLLGWSEPALHMGMWLPILALLWGVFALAQRLGASPAFSTLAVLTTPVVLVSATSLMTDVPMLALWCWAVVLWIDGSRHGDGRRLAAAGVLAGLVFCTKYTGIVVLPLLAAWSLARDRRPSAGMLYLAIPVGMIVAFQSFMWFRYGVLPLGDGVDYSMVTRASKRETALGTQALVGLFFLGGCFLPALLFAPLLWSRRVLIAGAAAGVAFACALPLLGSLGPLPLHDEQGPRWALIVQAALFAVCGVQVLALSALALWQRRSPEAWLLACWVGGVFVFAAFANWTTNGRSLLPAAPALGILLAWRLAERLDPDPHRWARRLAAPLAAGLAISLCVAWADWKLANSARVAAAELHARWSDRGGHLWFQGAWGFSYYLQGLGVDRLDFDRSDLMAGDILIVPVNNAIQTPPHGALVLLEKVSFPAAGWIATMARPLGAGFHADIFGPLPYAVGAAPPETYGIFGVVESVQLRRAPGFESSLARP